MIELELTELEPRALQSLTALDQLLTGAGLADDAQVLLLCTPPDLPWFTGSSAAAWTERLPAARPQAVVMPGLDTLGPHAGAATALASGRSAFEMRDAVLLLRLAELPAHALVRCGRRGYLRIAMPQDVVAAAAPVARAQAPSAPLQRAVANTPAGPSRYSTTHDFAMYCKSYRGDLARAQVMVETFNRFNRDGITLHISCPAQDQAAFSPLAGPKVQIIADESFAGPFLADQPMNGMSTGYVNQQICKLNFYRTGLAANYLAVDSDTVFIRDFHTSDFMHDAGVPYTVLVMDKDLSIERHYRHVHWVSRQALIAQIYAYVGVNDRRLRACHNAQVMNIRVLDTLHREFMRSKGLNYIEMLRLVGYEFSWYNVWFQKCRYVPEFAVEPFFKMLHMRPEYVMSRIRLLREQDYAEAYVGLVLNSKWRPATPLRYADPTADHVAFYELMMRDENAISELLKQTH